MSSALQSIQVDLWGVPMLGKHLIFRALWRSFAVKIFPISGTFRVQDQANFSNVWNTNFVISRVFCGNPIGLLSLKIWLQTLTI